MINFQFEKFLSWIRLDCVISCNTLYVNYSLTTFAQHLFNKSWTDVGQMLDERSVQTVSAPFNIFKNKENVESMFNESFNQFKFDSKHFQQAFNNVERPVKTPPTFGSTTVLNACRSKCWNHLRLPYTFAGVLREKKYLRVVLNASTTNYISVQS